MATLLERLVDRLLLEEVEVDVFRGGSGTGGVTVDNRLFGGLVAAQAAAAAARTADGIPMHSLHAYFLRPGRPERDMEFRVKRLKEGRNFQARAVEVWQREQLIFHLQHLAFAPAKGHSGFERVVVKDDKAIGTGSYFHQLHHKHFECNYGNDIIHLDKWFGTFHDGSKEAEKKMNERFLAAQRRASGAG